MTIMAKMPLSSLSDNGVVTRGLCEVDANGYLTDVHETKNIAKVANGAESDGKELDPNSYCSMNMWALTPEFMDMLEEGFVEFLKTNDDPIKGEYLIPTYIGELLEAHKITVKVIETKDKWFGVTYKEDKETVVESFKNLINTGVYLKDLYLDLD